MGKKVSNYMCVKVSDTNMQYSCKVTLVTATHAVLK